ncbi:expressed protein [Phakopsora pachyrhizi]|uniref:Expressed protein n=1 Tax=Phakopsora pachyrhizi TaxID=170000 RepID=A0AAV0BKK3_PHAPC|nr:expressed protein [Phakopsora pachyrhizi]
MALLVAIGSTDGRVKILRLDFNQSDIHLGHNITINQNNVNCKINDDSRNQPNKMKLDKIFEYAPHQNGVCCLKLKPVVIQNPKKPSENYKNRYVSMEDDREKLIILILTGGDDSLINLQFLKISLKKLSNKLEELDHYYSKNIPNLIEFGNVAIKSAHSAAINDIGIFNYKNINLNHTKKIPTKEITSKYNQSLFLQILLPADKECKEEIVLNEEENSDLIIFSLSSNNLIKKWYIPLKVKKFNISLNQVKDPNLDKFGNDSNQLINTEYQLKPFEGIVSSFDIKGNCNSFENFELKTNVYDCSKFDIIMNESNQDIKLLLPCGNYPYQRYFCSNHFNFFVSKPSTNSECKTINDTYKYDAPTKSDKIEFDFRIYLVGIGLEILKTKLIALF